MIKPRLSLFLILAIMAGFSALPVSASQIAPDKAQSVLDLMSVECQSLYDYSASAAAGDYSRYDSVKQRFSVAINNISVILSGYENDSIQNLWKAYNGFTSDAASAQNTAGICMQVRSTLYQKMTQVGGALNSQRSITSYADCVSAGYYVNGDTCFIGGTTAYDQNGNIIGLYYADCYDYTGFHQGTCWDCKYGASSEGCNPKP